MQTPVESKKSIMAVLKQPKIIIAIAIPLIIFIGLWVAKPGFVLTTPDATDPDVKKIDWSSVFKWTFIGSVLGWGVEIGWLVWANRSVPSASGSKRKSKSGSGSGGSKESRPAEDKKPKA